MEADKLGRDGTSRVKHSEWHEERDKSRKDSTSKILESRKVVRCQQIDISAEKPPPQFSRVRLKLAPEPKNQPRKLPEALGRKDRIVIKKKSKHQ